MPSRPAESARRTSNPSKPRGRGSNREDGASLRALSDFKDDTRYESMQHERRSRGLDHDWRDDGGTMMGLPSWRPGYGAALGGAAREHDSAPPNGSLSWPMLPRVMGGYAGKGPKGYKRSDERIRDEVCDALLRAHDVDASSIEVRVRSGEVSLIGTVPERSMKLRAEVLCDGILGVTEIDNRLTIGRQPVSTSHDARKTSSKSNGKPHGRERGSTDVRSK